MKRFTLLVLLFCAAAFSVAQNQPSSTGRPLRTEAGSGTPGRIPVFGDASTVRDSAISQDASATIHLGDNAAIDAAGNQTALSGIFSGVLGGVIGEDQTTNNPDLTVWGVIGIGDNIEGGGILGVSRPIVNSDGIGVFGRTNGDRGIGVIGRATSLTGTTVGVRGVSFSANGAAGQFINNGGGSILSGLTHNGSVQVFSVDSAGNVHANSYVGLADFAESLEVAGERKNYSAGDLLVIDPTKDRSLALAQEPYSRNVAGIFSTAPGMLGTSHPMDSAKFAGEVPLAIVGIVPCKVTTENGPIARGDLLVASSTPGYAMKGTDPLRMLGAIVGKALQPLTSGTGRIEVLVTLQ
jgi:hypothetical protein